MIITMKYYEKLAMEFANQFKSWDHQCVSKDTYLNAIKLALSLPKEELEKEVEVEFTNGSHQLTDDIK